MRDCTRDGRTCAGQRGIGAGAAGGATPGRCARPTGDSAFDAPSCDNNRAFDSPGRLTASRDGAGRATGRQRSGRPSASHHRGPGRTAGRNAARDWDRHKEEAEEETPLRALWVLGIPLLPALTVL